MLTGRLPIYALIFLFMYAPVITISGQITLIKHITYILLSTVFLYRICFHKIHISHIFYIILFSAPFVWIALLYLITGVFDREIFLIWILGVVTILAAHGAALFVHRVAGKDVGIFAILSIYISGVAHAVIMIAAFAWDPFRDVLYSIVYLGSVGQHFVSLGLRSPGLTSGGGDALSAIQGLALVFGIYYLLMIRHRVSILAFMLHGMAFSLLVLSIFLSARTGLVVTAAGIVMICIKYAYHSLKDGKLKLSPIYRMISIFSVITLTLLFIYFMIDLSGHSRAIRRALEPFTNYLYSGSLSTRSTDVLFSDMLFLPDSPIQFLFGDGNFGRNDFLPYIPSDSGYVRIIHGSGILGLALMSLFYIFIVFHSVALRRYDEHVAFLAVVSATIMIIVNIKVLHIGGFRETFAVMSFLFAVLSLSGMQSREAAGEYRQSQMSKHPIMGST